jgi:hypothetical protein
MKIKYEAEVKDCSECKLYCEFCGVCQYDEQEDEPVNGRRFFPCQIRPCPIEIK